MGASGFLYESAKDQTKWHGLQPKQWVKTIMDIGTYLALSKEDWQKAKREKTKGDVDIGSALIAAFGDGKNSK